MPARREEVRVRCPGSQRAIVIINRRYVRWRCRQKRCRQRRGEDVYHLADGLTGRLVRTEYEVDGEIIRTVDHKPTGGVHPSEED